jgi:acetylornithine deacetylase/succinyl-diaminopimelate desuccinylase-like protein
MNSEVVSLLQSLIRNECVNYGQGDGGHEYRSVKTLSEYFGVEGEVFEPAKGRQSLIYRISGSDPGAPSLALVPHLDVVPVDPDGWSQNPFGGDIVDGFVYGRGAVDMLNVTAAMSVAAKPYITGELKPRGDLVFVAVADEEGGAVYGAEPLVRDRWDLVNADYLLTEVAYPAPSNVARPVVPVAIGEKGGFWSVLKAQGTPGHGSSPYGTDNALRKMTAAVHGIFETPMPVSITPEWVNFVGALDLENDLKEALIDPDHVDGAIDDIAVTDPLFARYAHAVTHLTVSPNMMDAGMKANMVADKASTVVDIRALPGMDKSFIDSYLFKAMGNSRDDIEIVPVMEHEATVSSVGNPLWDAIAEGVADLEGHRNLLPTLMNVATDARFWRMHGTVSYGVGLFDDRMSFSEMLALFHGHDERVSVGSVERTLSLYERVLAHFFIS